MQKATLRDGTQLEVGEEVTTKWHKKCIGEIFVIAEIVPYDFCESKTKVLVHLKGHPDRKIIGFNKPGYTPDSPPGLDANWFKKAHPENKTG